MARGEPQTLTGHWPRPPEATSRTCVRSEPETPVGVLSARRVLGRAVVVAEVQFAVSNRARAPARIGEDAPVVANMVIRAVTLGIREIKLGGETLISR